MYIIQCSLLSKTLVCTHICLSTSMMPVSPRNFHQVGGHGKSLNYPPFLHAFLAYTISSSSLPLYFLISQVVFLYILIVPSYNLLVNLPSCNFFFYMPTPPQSIKFHLVCYCIIHSLFISCRTRSLIHTSLLHSI